MARILSTGLRAALFVAALTALSWAAWRLAGRPLGAALAAAAEPGGVTGLRFDQALGAVLAGALLAGWGWFAVTSGLLTVRLTLRVAREDDRQPLDVAVAEAHRHGPAALARRLVPAVLGVTVAGGLALPAGADPVGAAGPATVHRVGVVGLPLPDRASGGLTPHGAPPSATVVVVPGDSLWRIAERLLPADASDYEVTDAWRRIYATNAARLGPDPDRVLPGTALDIPDLIRHHREEAS
jgi:hypothetical protein